MVTRGRAAVSARLQHPALGECSPLSQLVAHRQSQKRVGTPNVEMPAERRDLETAGSYRVEHARDTRPCRRRARRDEITSEWCGDGVRTCRCRAFSCARVTPRPRASRPGCFGETASRCYRWVRLAVDACNTANQDEIRCATALASPPRIEALGNTSVSAGWHGLIERMRDSPPHRPSALHYWSEPRP